MPPEIHAGVVHAFDLSLQTVFLWAVPLTFVGFLASWLLRELPLRSRAHLGVEPERTEASEMAGEASAKEIVS